MRVLKEWLALLFINIHNICSRKTLSGHPWLWILNECLTGTKCSHLRLWACSRSSGSPGPCIDVCITLFSWSHPGLQHGHGIAGTRNLKHHHSAAFTCHSPSFCRLVQIRFSPSHRAGVLSWVLHQWDLGWHLFLCCQKFKALPILSQHYHRHVAGKCKKAPLFSSLQTQLSGRREQYRSNSRFLRELGADKLPFQRSQQGNYHPKCRKTQLLHLWRRRFINLSYRSCVRYALPALWLLFPGITLLRRAQGLRFRADPLSRLQRTWK